MIKVWRKRDNAMGEYLQASKQADGCVSAMNLSYAEANQLQADLRRELTAAGVTLRDAV